MIKPNYFIFNLLFLWGSYCFGTQLQVGKPLPCWQKGYLDIYHIHEGAGNSTFMIFPDGTTLLYDIGDAAISYKKQSTLLPEYSPVLPNTSKPSYAWVAQFINKFSPHPGKLDYVLLSHYHFDHMGEWSKDRAEQTQGHFKLFGITGLGEKIHIHTLIDRSYPNYDYHGDIPGNLNNYLFSTRDEYAHLTALTMQSYKRFINYQITHNHLKVEKFKVGNNSQIHLIYHPYPNFKVRNIIGAGYVWTGKGESTYHFIQYADKDQLNAKEENNLSNGFRIDYGAFRYFTGGDITGRELTGKDIDNSAEDVAAPVIGNVDVATLDHHGFDDAQSNIFVKTLRPTVWIQQNWAVSQTSLPMILRTLDTRNYSYSRNLFALHYFKLNDLALPALGNPNQQKPIEQYYKNTGGDIVIRVSPEGKKYWVILLINTVNKLVVKAIYGPYFSHSQE
ncbi:MAG: hypothetical protein RJA83_89 [Pseudomonadota bacterium]|jgi:hypothetical protein